MKLCSVIFVVTLRLLVINTSSSVSREQQTTPLIATSDECHQLATVRRSCVYNTWRWQRWQHAMKPDIGGESRFWTTPPAFDGPLGVGSRRNIVTTFGAEKPEWFGYPTVKNCGRYRYVYLFQQNTRTWRTDTARRHRSRLCTASRGKNIRRESLFIKWHCEE